MKTDWFFSPWFLVSAMLAMIAISVLVFLLTDSLFMLIFVPLPLFYLTRKK
jgi:hypothetical protein